MVRFVGLLVVVLCNEVFEKTFGCGANYGRAVGRDFLSCATAVVMLRVGDGYHPSDVVTLETEFVLCNFLTTCIHVCIFSFMRPERACIQSQAVKTDSVLLATAYDVAWHGSVPGDIQNVLTDHSTAT